MQGQLRWSWWGERERRLFYISEKQVADVAHIFWWIHRLLLPLVANMSGMLVLISGTPGGTLLLHQPLSSNLTASAAAASCKIPPPKKKTSPGNNLTLIQPSGTSHQLHFSVGSPPDQLHFLEVFELHLQLPQLTHRLFICGTGDAYVTMPTHRSSSNHLKAQRKKERVQCEWKLHQSYDIYT